LERSRVIGVDVGGTKILAAVVAREGQIEARVERETAVSSEEALLSELDAMVDELRADAPDMAALGFGIPSRVDQRKGRAVASVNIPLEGLDFRDRMQERHGVPVGIDNDANAAAIGEWHAGAARGANNVVMLTLDGPPCGCGGRGHLESFAAGPAGDRAARELYGPDSGAQELVRRGQDGDADAVSALAKIGRYLGAGIASFVNVFEPELVVVGGGFGAAGELLLASAREVVTVDGLVPGRDTVRIVQAALGGDAGVIGAGMIAFEALGAGP
jgi:glucokinase